METAEMSIQSLMYNDTDTWIPNFLDILDQSDLHFNLNVIF